MDTAPALDNPETSDSDHTTEDEVTNQNWFLRQFFLPVPIDTLVYFRIALGAILLWEVYRFLSAGWPRVLFLDPPFHFHYFGFSWVEVPSAPILYAYFYGMGLLSLMIISGCLYRFAMPLMFLGFSYLFLLEQATYLNHFYLVTLICGIMCFLPANRAFSIDAKLWPSIRSATVSQWVITLLRLQVGLAYFFGGVAKCNPDWLSGLPMQMMLLENDDFPLVRSFFGEPEVALFFAYSGLLLDLFIVPALWWKPTRIPALLAAAGFHIMNDMLFRIGIFPWFMLAATLILWPPFRLTPLNLLRTYGSLIVIRRAMEISELPGGPVPPGNLIISAIVIAGLVSLWFVKPKERVIVIAALAVVNLGTGLTVGVGLYLIYLAIGVPLAILLSMPPKWLRELKITGDGSEKSIPVPQPMNIARWCTLGGVCLYLTWQFLMPWRHWLYPGDVHWTEEGHKYAWHMKLRVKRAEYVKFFIVDEQGFTLEEVPIFTPETLGGLADLESDDSSMWIENEEFSERTRLTPRQARAMATRPELIRQYAHYLREIYERELEKPVQVMGYINISLNGREPQLLVDPDRDLSRIEATWGSDDWILPNSAPLPPLIRRIVSGYEPAVSR
ncbi:HTTM domain-containing protein [Calycomorphotria hydatis]|uniref:Vitamin K-dependent gamma-carboxylase n=1 Tax=Calycomorphotria hydatis TaxID=2528027 RepID=A0A517TBH1_9PLAN|nr:HTTM domain-containing protein [Calycomorphotria hydatis]QDT65716.1 Vitamin K-dependent gamma-carboxylase [Calycomorphotria hydatis]